ncbi:MAG: transcriptional regulator [Microcystis sp. M048S1]|uniref:helix-turn-helix domain-containing protein n=1 Tax=unclassified Microcystis TaxID=2643300 RepID=UPI0011950A92|nr:MULTISPECIES: transcriptional regulator [unclassified Microcystis]MCA2901746.1 transcriptional regulator [Microcystis sp. M035S1]MCA2723985.1 transcriptional regulator [Microcystis sp. M176S2]MCA2726472.1 transcriptional regulator [Microcystis sp. M166S2]MCA2731418.1 transcriptional regulator [Microcystis sp. M162S2]MCA2748295.1 transcriptional regulator [Microcystis sp. M155S2]
MSGKMTLTLNCDTYGRLLAEYLPKVIENDAENEQAIILAESLSHRENRSLEETTLLNLLLTLIEKYEQDHYPLEESEPHSILWELMEANNLQEKDLSDILGSKTIVSDILIGQQIITEKQAVKLGQFFHVDSSLFLSTQ